MAIDTTQQLALLQDAPPVEVVATLGLTAGEYRIENGANQQEDSGGRSTIRFVASASRPAFFDNPRAEWRGHGLAVGAREDISVEAGQQWFFWAEESNTNLIITAAGGAIGGSAPRLRLPSFHLDIFRVVADSASIPTSAPTGGSYNLDTTQLTPPTGWSESQRPVSGTQVEVHSRALIDPNIGPTDDRILTPVWSIPQRVSLIGTITSVATETPLAGGGQAGAVTISVQTRGIDNDQIATDAIDLRTLAGGTAGNYIGFDSTGAASSVSPHQRIEQLDVPQYSTATEGQVLTVESGAPAWTDKTPPAPRDIEFYYGHVVPSPEGHDDIWFVDAEANNVSGVVESDLTTPRTMIFTGDIYEYDSTAGALGNGAWVFAANQAVEYEEASETRAGLMSPADKTKIDGIESGAEVNVNPDWLATEGDARILNKPTIPAAPVNADWNATVGLAVIRNKPTSIVDFDVPDYSTQQDNRVLGLSSSSLAWIDTGVLRIVIGAAFPSNPAEGNHVFFNSDVDSLTGYFEADGTTSRTSAMRGEVALYQNSKWIHQGSLNTEYAEATSTTGGLLTNAQAVKLTGIHDGAEVNVNADWNATSGDAEILNKPTLPTIPGNATTSTAGLMSSSDKSKLNDIESGAEVNVNADWNASTGDAQILNKPDIPDIPDAPAAETTDTRYELEVSAAGVASWEEIEALDIDTLSVGAALPTDNVSLGNWHIQTANQTSNVPTDVREADGTTARTSLIKGDIYRRAEEQGTEVWTLEGNVDTIYGNATQSVGGLMSSGDKTKLDGINANAEVNVQSDWTETDTDADSFILNKPTIPSGQVQSDWNQTDTDAVDYIENKPTIPAAQVQSDWSQTDTDAVDYIENKPTIPDLPSHPDAGMADSDYALSVDTDGNPTWTETTLYSAAEKTKLTGIEAGAEVNVQSDWNATTGDAFIANKPDIPAAQVQSDWNQTDTDAVDFIENKPTVPDTPVAPATGAATEHYTLQIQSDGTKAWSATRTYTTAEKTKLAGIAAGAEVNVQSDWNATSGDAFIANKPTIPDAQVQADWQQTDSDAVDFIDNKPTITDPVQSDWQQTDGSVLSFIRNKPSIPDIPDAPSAAATDRHYNLQVDTAGEISWTRDVTSSGGEQNVQSDWNETNAADDAFILNKPGAATTTTIGLMSAADKEKLDGIEGAAEVNVQSDWLATTGDSFIRNRPPIPTLPTDNANFTLRHNNNVYSWNETEIYTTGEQTKLSGIATGAEVNVQSDWNATTGDAQILNKPDIPNTPDSPAAAAQDLQYNLQVSTTGAVTWEQDTGGGATGGEDNVQSDWNETDTASDAFILNKPTIPAAQVNSDWDATSGAAQILNKPTLAGRFMGAYAIRTAYAMGDVVFSTGQFWRARQDVPDNRVGAPTNELDYWQQETFGIGIASSLPTFVSNAEYDLNRDRWVILTADETLTGTRDGTGTAPYVADIQDTGTLADITGNQLTQLNRGDILRLDTWPTRYWARMVNAFVPSVPNAPSALSAARDYNLRVAADGTTTWEQDTGGGAGGGEQNVQSDWDETDTASDAYIQNKPSIPTIPGNATDSVAGLMSALDKDKLDSIASNAEVNVQADWTVTNTTNDSFIRNKPTIPTLPTDSEIGDKAFSNPPTDLTDAEKTAVRTAIGSGTGSGGEDNVQADWDETDTASDAYIQNKPTIPTIPGNATDSVAGLMSALDKDKLDSIASSAEVNVQADWNQTNTTNDSFIRNKPTIPDLPSKPANPAAQTQYNLQLTTTGTASWVTDTGGGGSGVSTFIALTDTPSAFGTAGQFLRINGNANALEFTDAPSGSGSSTFAGLSDTPSMLGSAGQYIRVNAAGDALEFVAAPMGGGSGTSRYLPSPDERATEGGFFYMGWTDDFTNSWGIRRVSLNTGAAVTATVANNSAYTTLAAAWPQRVSLTYA